MNIFKISMGNYGLMNKTVAFAFVIFINVTHALQESVKNVYYSQCLKQQVFLELYGLSILDCNRECTARKDCKSFNYNRSYHRCQLNMVAKAISTKMKLDNCTGDVLVEKSYTGVR